MRPRQRSNAPRDQATSAFSAFLLRLCDGTNAVGVALVDAEGETVDYAGRMDPYEIKVAAAEWRLVLSFVADSPVPSWSETRQILVRAKKRSFIVVALEHGYALVAQLPLGCFQLSPRALSECARDVSREAGFDPPPVTTLEARWTRVEVRTQPHDRRRPVAVWLGGSWSLIEILGRYPRAELGRGEVGYRARLASGAEITLVRERLGAWYAEDLPH